LWASPSPSRDVVADVARLVHSMTTCHHGNLAVYQGRLWVTHTGCLPGARHVAGLPACLSWDLLPRHRLGTVLPRLNAASAPHYRGAMLA
ncbi:hypothetical protein Q604_UNBC06532G0001, partial [human gut metagenome]